MRILYISKSVIPSRSANSIHVMKMCQAFSDNGHEVVLLAPKIIGKYENKVTNIYEYYGVKKNFQVKKIWHPNIKSGAIIYTLGIFFYLFFTKRFNLIYGRFLHGCYISTLFNYNVIYESHTPIFHNKNYNVLIFKQLIQNKHFKKMIVISQALKDLYLKKGYLSDSKIKVAHDGADEVINFNQKIDLMGKKKNLKVGYVGHLYKGKGMEIISSISDKLDDDVEIHIIGGMEKDINYWKNKVRSKNIYFYGFIPHKHIGNYINSLDICLLPNQKIIHTHGSDVSRRSVNISNFTSPLKLFEYMSHKKAIIASDLPVLKEVLNHKNSILVKHNNESLWLRSIKKLKSKKNRKLISEKALKDFYKFTWKNRAIKVVKSL